MLLKCSLFILLLPFHSGFCDDKGELYRWNVMSYHEQPREDSYQIKGNPYYVAENNIPTGITPYKDRIFVSIARTNFGIPSTLNYIEFREARNDKSPSLRAYPDYDTNELHSGLEADSKRIVSVYRTRIDLCNRLWFIDTGVLEMATNPPTVIQKPSLWVIDLRTHKTLHRVEIPDAVHMNMPTGFKSINVDVMDILHCDEAYAYMPNSKSNVLVVYSLKDNKMWALADPSMAPEEDYESVTVNGKTYTVTEGIDSVVLGKRINRVRTVYYHSLASYQEFSIPNTVLKNVSLADTIGTSTEFKLVGNRGDKSNSGMHDMDLRTGVVFFTQIQKNSIICWDSAKPLFDRNIATVFQHDATLIYPADIKMDIKGYIWFLSNKSPIYTNPSTIKSDELNFFIYKRNVRDLIEGTICENSISEIEGVKSIEEKYKNDDEELK